MCCLWVVCLVFLVPVCVWDAIPLAFPDTRSGSGCETGGQNSCAPPVSPGGTGFSRSFSNMIVERSDVHAVVVDGFSFDKALASRSVAWAW
eukprot:14549256-Alexandrium_andersonii.AAC.1